MANFTRQNDYVPAGGPVSAPAAGGQLQTSGWYDVSGGNWSVTASNQIADVSFTGSPWQTGVLARAVSEASTADQQLRVKIIAPTPSSSNNYALLHYLRYSGSPNTQNGYLVNFGADSSGALQAFFFSVNGGSVNYLNRDRAWDADSRKSLQPRQLCGSDQQHDDHTYCRCLRR